MTAKKRTKKEQTQETTDNDPNMFEAVLEKGFKRLSSGKIVTFKELGESIEGILISVKPPVSKRSSAVLTFEAEDGSSERCFSSHEIDSQLISSKIMSENYETLDSKTYVRITFCGRIPLAGGKRTLKTYAIDVKE